ncbi:MAG: hypothetical protein WC856_02470 [Methylococcaceae bacterium]|jgi:hypothetical protein
MNRLHGYSLSEHDLKLDELNRTVVEDPDPEKRNIFSILQSHAVLLSRITLALEETINNNAAKVEGHETRIKRHEDLVIQGKTVISMLSVLQLFVAGFFMYGYSLIANMRDEVNQHSTLLPRIDAITTEFMQQSRTLAATSDHIQQQAQNNVQQDDKLEALDGDVKNIQKKRVFKASR